MFKLGARALKGSRFKEGQRALSWFRRERVKKSRFKVQDKEALSSSSTVQ
jgi:hypothetical protein